MISAQTKGVLESLTKALTEAEQDFDGHAAAEKLAGNVVKEAGCRGMTTGVRLAILLIGHTVKQLESELTQAAAHPMTKDYLLEAAEAVQARLPDNHGFLLLAAPYGEGNGRLVYTSTFQRADALNVLKEFLLRNDAVEDWMKHIK